MTSTNTSTYNSPNPNKNTSTYNSPNTNTSKHSPSKPNSFQKLEAGQLRHHEIEHFFTNEKDVVNNCEPLSWSNCDATTFNVRRGPNYISGQKTPSQKAIYEVFAIDAYSNPNKINFFQQFLNVDKYVNNYREKYNYRYHKQLCPLPPIIVVNIMVPNYAPELSTNKSDGDGFQMVLCAQLNADVRKFYQKRYQRYINKYIQKTNNTNTSSSVSISNSPSLSSSSSDDSPYKKCTTDDYIPASFQLLSNFVHSDLTDKVNNPLRNRFKCIARVMNTESSGFNFITKRLVQQYNGRPFLARTSSTFYHKIGEYFSADIDVHLFGYPARKGLHYTKSTVAQIIFDLAMVIEGHTDGELPEQVLCCARISKVGIETALKFPEHLQVYNNQKNEKSDENEEEKSDDDDENGDVQGGGSVVGDGGQGQMDNVQNGKEVKNGCIDNHQIIANETSLDKIFGVFAWGGMS